MGNFAPSRLKKDLSNRVKGRGIVSVGPPLPSPRGVLKHTPQGKPSPVKGEGKFLLEELEK
jgi:hypothetical protein